VERKFASWNTSLRERRTMAPSLVVVCGVLLGAAGVLGVKRDVIMIAIDDMRPELGCYGCDYMKVRDLREWVGTVPNLETSEPCTTRGMGGHHPPRQPRSLMGACRRCRRRLSVLTTCPSHSLCRHPLWTSSRQSRWSLITCECRLRMCTFCATLVALHSVSHAVVGGHVSIQ
jgi:hypothetical protein